MLIEQDWVTVGINRDKAGKPGCIFVRPAEQLHALLFQAALQITNTTRT
jgi:hypothetical protein